MPDGGQQRTLSPRIPSADSLEGLGLPPLAPQTVAFVLVASFAVGIERFSRRYQ